MPDIYLPVWATWVAILLGIGGLVWATSWIGLWSIIVDVAIVVGLILLAAWFYRGSP